MRSLWVGSFCLKGRARASVNKKEKEKEKEKEKGHRDGKGARERGS
jgi:hypothetical protein